ncbi:MAG: AI-2E family transporter, partial [Proteobacteria bacterium]|nr:AI-2E family transporter [Pseudomonadota bacterium]
MAEAHRLTWIAGALVVAATVFVVPMAPAVILAVWAAEGLRVLHTPLTRALRGRSHLAAALTTMLLLLVAIPLGIVIASVAMDAYGLIVQVVESGRFIDTRRTSDPLQLLIDQREQAWAMASSIAGTTTRSGIGIFVFVAGTYGVLIEGPTWWAWIRDHTPLSTRSLDVFHHAFFETGRGLLIGIGGAGLLQALAATIAFIALGVPHAFALGFLTLCASVLPAIGSALVWVPIAIGLAVTGRTTAGIVMASVGVLVISTIDNLVRPMLARRGHLQLPGFVVVVAMFGGVETMGGWGLVIAPLVVRLAKAALELR